MIITTTAYDRVVERLIAITGYSPPRPGGSWRCPNTARHKHGDRDPSLSVTPAPDRVLIKCQGGCDVVDVLGALGLTPADLFDTKGPVMNGNGKHGLGEPVAVYPYVDVRGATVLEVVRYSPKTFRQRVPDPREPGGYRWKVGDVEKPPYRLPEVVQAVLAGRRVWIVEGEKDVHALERAGEVATCNAGGAGKWERRYAEYLYDAEVIVVADKDAAGYEHARKVVDSLRGVAAVVLVVQAATGKDAADHLGAGLGVDEFAYVELGRLNDPFDHADFPTANEGPEDNRNFADYEAEAAPAIEAEIIISNPFDRVPLDITARPEPRPTIGQYVYRGGFTVMQSEPGVGKTWLALYVVLGIIRDGGVVLYFDEEGGDDLMRERLYALGASQDEIAERFYYFPFEARVWNDDDLVALKAIVVAAGEAGPVQLAVFDSLPDFLAAAGLSEDKAQDVTTFINRVCGTLREHGVAQIALDHLTKPPADKGGRKERSRYARGSGSKLAKADATVLIETAEPFDANRSGKLRLWKTKDRYGRLDVPRLDEPGRLLDVRVGGGRVQIGEAPKAEVWAGPTECIASIEGALRGAGELTTSQLKKVVPFRAEVVTEALSRMAKDGRLTYRAGPRNAIFYRLAEEVVDLDADPEALGLFDDIA